MNINGNPHEGIAEGVGIPWVPLQALERLARVSETGTDCMEAGTSCLEAVVGCLEADARFLEAAVGHLEAGGPI